MRRWVAAAVAMLLILAACSDSDERLPWRFASIGAELKKLPGVESVTGGRWDGTEEVMVRLAADAPAGTYHAALVVMSQLLDKYPDITLDVVQSMPCSVNVTWYSTGGPVGRPIDIGEDAVTAFVGFGRDQCIRTPAPLVSMSQFGGATWCTVWEASVPTKARLDEAAGWATALPMCTTTRMVYRDDPRRVTIQTPSLARQANRSAMDALSTAARTTSVTSLEMRPSQNPDMFDAVFQFDVDMSGWSWKCGKEDVRTLYTAAHGLPGNHVLIYCDLLTEVQDGRLRPIPPDATERDAAAKRELYDYEVEVAYELNR